jgi:hypothetical protein
VVDGKDASQRGGANGWRRRPLRRVTGPWTPSSLDMVMVWISLLPFLVAAKGEANLLKWWGLQKVGAPINIWSWTLHLHYGIEPLLIQGFWAPLEPS